MGEHDGKDTTPEPDDARLPTSHGTPAPDDATDGEQVYTWYAAGRERLAAGQPRAAVEVLELAAQQAPSAASLQETLARAYFATRRIARARVAFERVLDLDPSDAYAHYGLARCLEREGDLHRAEKHLKLACAMSSREEYHEVLDRVMRRRSA